MSGGANGSVAGAIHAVNITCPFIGAPGGGDCYDVDVDTFSSPTCDSNLTLVYSGQTNGPENSCVRSYFSTPANSSVQQLYVTYTCSPPSSSNSSRPAHSSLSGFLLLIMLGVAAAVL